MTNDEVLKPKRNRVTRMFSSFGFRYSTPAWVGSFVLRNSFELRHSSPKDVLTRNRARPRDNDCPIHRTQVQTSSRRAVSRSARRFRALHFLLAMFHRRVPLAESSLLNRYHPSSYFEINRDHHLRPLVGDNRQ